jgi:UDP-N-acetylmuramyl pentapeptide phosphotransferase/UDP-N-acetylglucosamine-1-phosphate transferase
MFTGIAILLLSFITASVITGRLIPFLRKRAMWDIPNDRSSHSTPTPRGGGIGILAGLTVGGCVAHVLGFPVMNWHLLTGIALIVVVGFVDDRKGLSGAIRLLSQVVAALIVLYGTTGLQQFPLPQPLNFDLGALGIPTAMLWIVAVTNIYNFLDGIDGYAGLQGIIAGLAIALLSEGTGGTLLGLSIAGSCLGFVLYNWHPAKVFMGDVGSATLGFLLAALPFQSDFRPGSGSVFVVAMCLWFFLADGVFTIVRRLMNGERIWAAHRSHIYQRLVQTGLRHDQVALRVMNVGAILSGLAVFLSRSTEPAAMWIVFVAAILSFLAYYFWLRGREKSLQTK